MATHIPSLSVSRLWPSEHVSMPEATIIPASFLPNKVSPEEGIATPSLRVGGLRASTALAPPGMMDTQTLRAFQMPTSGRPAPRATHAARAMSKPSQSVTDEEVVEGSPKTDAKSSAVALESPSSSGLQLPAVLREPSLTGGAMSFRGATEPLVVGPLPATKTIVMVRHGLSMWNSESRIQGCSDLSLLSDLGKWQAVQCREALRNTHFDCCFASPISRAKTSAELIWEGREEPLIFMDSLREANLHFLEGMTNADAKKEYPELYRAWREDPLNFNVNGVYPVVSLWASARGAWRDILTRQGETVLVVTHKSILRALLCIALGLGPDRFRAMDINNSGVCVFEINKRGEPMLKALNMTSHLSVPGLLYDI